MDREERKKQQKKKNREIMRITNSFVALFLLMMLYLSVYSMTHREELINNSYNNRQQILLAQNRRGTIYSRDGEALAETVEKEDGDEKRVYPYGELFAHVVGYTAKGKTGIESQANFYLIQSSSTLASKVQDEIAGNKSQGDSVYTTLDVGLQEAANKALGVYRGAIVAMDPGTGEVLAMVSKPDYDPNQIAEIWDKLLEDEESGVLLNRVTQGLYPPGSTFKIITALEYIRENPDTYGKYRFDCNGVFQLGEDKIKCYHGTKHGSEDLKKSFAKSCNSSFASIGVGLDREKLARTLNGLMFNQELPVNFSYNQSRIVVSKDTSDSDMMQNAIGQGKTQVTPLQLAMITSAVANGGIAMTPYLLEKVENSEGESVKKFGPSKCGRMMSEEEAAVLTEYMEEVIQSGTGTKLSGLSYSVAGKTGSAEYSGVKEDSHAWFTGFAPADDPEIIVTVIIEGAGSGGDYAVPIAKRVFDAYFQEAQ